MPFSLKQNQKWQPLNQIILEACIHGSCKDSVIEKGVIYIMVVGES